MATPLMVSTIAMGQSTFSEAMGAGVIKLDA
jgi:hypothetical protein